MASELCPKCLAPRNMSWSKSTREEVDSEGNTKKITTKNYHCEMCHSFVRSEQFEETEEDFVGEGANAALVAMKG